jgi:hypothetical protein
LLSPASKDQLNADSTIAENKGILHNHQADKVMLRQAAATIIANPKPYGPYYVKIANMIMNEPNSGGYKKSRSKRRRGRKLKRRTRKH